MKLTKDILKYIEINRDPKTWKNPDNMNTSRLEIDCKHILKYNSSIMSDTVFNNPEATKRLMKELLGFEFKEDDILIAPREHSNGYNIFFRINYIPYLKGWAETMGEALMVRDWIVN